jgi:hypothetical protein
MLVFLGGRQSHRIEAERQLLFHVIRCLPEIQMTPARVDKLLEVAKPSPGEPERGDFFRRQARARGA